MVPSHVETATEVFADCDAYVYISSGSAYARQDVPLREDETPLHEYDPEEDDADPMATVPELYGPRKAACDRAVFAAAEAGVNAVAVRPMLVYGPHDYTERTDYWIDRIANHDRIVVPGDGDSLLHRAYVEDVAAALVRVAEEGEAGEAYNVADRQLVTLEEKVDRFAEALDAEVEVVHASARDLAESDLEPRDFPLYVPYPGVVTTEKLHELGWTSTDLETAYERTVEEHRESDRDGRNRGPDRDAEQRVIDSLAP
jgi:nucleoside-diphosphate-sugar epimerase